MHSTEKQQDVRMSNINAAKGILDLIRTSLGPRGLDKMLKTPKGDVLITNDGATIMKQLEARHPAARMLVELSQAQDVEAGDGTTSVVVLAAQMLANCIPLFKLGIHPTQVSQAFEQGQAKALEFIRELETPVDVNDDALLESIARTTLSSKVVSHHSGLLAPMIVRAVKQITQGLDGAAEARIVDLRRIHVIKKLNGTLDDCQLLNGAAFTRTPSGVQHMTKPKVGLISFCLSPPKTEMDCNVVVSDDAEINKLLEQERKLTLKMCKAVAKAGVNVLVIQKQTLRQAISEMAQFYLQKLKIAVISEVERETMEYVSEALGAPVVSTLEEFQAGKVVEIEEMSVKDGITYLQTSPRRGAATRTCCLVVRGANKLIVDEAERSIRDGLCSVRSLLKAPALVPGGATVEVHLAQKLRQWAATLDSASQYCVQYYADAFEVVPATLAENAGLNPIAAVTALRAKHAAGTPYGLDVCGSGQVTDMKAAKVVQPVLVSRSEVQLATETARMLLKIDDIVIGR